MGAYLGGADLTGANLQRARLSQADLRRASLTGASLRNARLQGANLMGADLRAVDFTGTEFEQLESIAGADFTLAQGLTQEQRVLLLGFPSQDLDLPHGLTRNTPRESLMAMT